jgi:NhaP-type Na+/H+ or K+/H+ antiporter
MDNPWHAGAFFLRIVGLQAARRVPAPETNPHHRTLRYMMPDFTIALAIGLVIGFILGYALRAIISYRRHRRARRRSYLF